MDDLVKCENCTHNATYLCWYGFVKYKLVYDKFTGMPRKPQPVDKSNKNSDGKCKDYNQKWWIFWIKN